MASAAISEVLLFALSMLVGLAAGFVVARQDVLPEENMLGGLILGAAGLAYLGFERLMRQTVPVRPLVDAHARKSVGMSVLVWLGAVVCALGGSTLLGILQEQLGVEVTEQDVILELIEHGSRVDLVMLAISAVVLAPLTEELLFRHMLFRRLMQRAGPTLAWVLPAIAFSLFHFNPSGLVIYAWLALVFAVAYLFSGRFIVAVAVHAGHNAFALAMLLWGPESGAGLP